MEIKARKTVFLGVNNYFRKYLHLWTICVKLLNVSYSGTQVLES